ncbi:MAG: hypothetical protein AAGE93_15290 [Bacteroidota bacterium]
MSVWRRKAIECLPEQRVFFEQPDTTIYQVFFELLPATLEAHRQNNTETLKKYYEFAEWCFRQNQRDLWNAAGVAFYEHLANYDTTLQAIPYWIAPDIYRDIRGLLELQLDDKKIEFLDKHYQYRKPS